MNRMTLIVRSLRFNWRLHASVAAGVAIATAALTGALLVGDSVDGSLRRFALQRLGRAECALHLRNRYVSSRLAEELARRTGYPMAAVLQLPGIAMATRSGRQANQVQILGMDKGLEAFGALAPPNDGEADVNLALARRLGLQPDDELALRIAKPSLLPREAPLSSRRDRPTVRVTLRVRRIVPDDRLGRFGLAANQTSPDMVFVSLNWIQEKTGLAGRANILLAAARDGKAPTTGTLDTALRAAWLPADSGLTLREVPEAGLKQLESDRIFLEPEVAAGAGRMAGSAGSLAYLVNTLASKSNGVERMTPYSFVVACAPSADVRLSPLPAGMADDEILINRWLAEQLAVGPGDSLAMAYYELATSGELVERTARFQVRSVIEMPDAVRERSLMPAFPGLTDVESCSDWDIGFPMNKEWLKDAANEAYWNAYRATPKAFVTLATGQRLWGNRYGNLTAIRFMPDEAGHPTAATIAGLVDPAKLGLFFQSVRADALKAVDEAIDFGGLFLGLSFFLVVAALLLTALLFVLSVEQRAPQTGLLLALGYTPRAVLGLLLGEGMGVAVVGAALGTVFATAYTRLLLWALEILWPDAVAGAVVTYFGCPESLLTGAAAGLIGAMVAMAVALRLQARHPARELLAGGVAQDLPAAPRGGRVALALALAATAGAGGIVVMAPGGEGAVEAFFGAGTLALAAFFGYGWFALTRLAAGGSNDRMTVTGLGLRNAGRRPGRSLAVAGLLAAGSFMVLAVASMQEDGAARAQDRRSGTGGFAFYGQTTLGMPRDVAEAKETGHAAGVEWVPIKRFDGDDASCFNLNRAKTPNLLGVDAADFVRRNAFADPETWGLLDRPIADGAVAALAGDSDTAMWGLQKRADGSPGNDLEYRDEQGRAFTVRLVGKLPMRVSVFQGAVLISERAFNAKYPSEDGYRVWLVDATPDRAEAVAERLGRDFERTGLDLEPAAQRLAAFGAVQRAYLRIFLALGGLGLLLGSAGMGVVVLRNVLERRGELAALRAMGFDRAAVRRVVRVEHLLLLGWGMVGGLCAAALAMLPSLRAPGADVPWTALAGLAVLLAASGLGWVFAAVAWATRGRLLDALRNE
jgi:ABC-type lipoprotein release transport system permease subunit